MENTNTNFSTVTVWEGRAVLL